MIPAAWRGRALGRLVPGLLLGAGLAGCVTKSDVQQVQADIALLKAESARRDSARAAQLAEVIQLQRRVMDSLDASRRSIAQLRGDFSNDLYNVQQQLLQLQELTGQSQQRLTELRTRLEARQEQIQSVPPAGPGTPGVPGDTTGDTTGAGTGVGARTGAPAASADQMYEASLAQLRRGSNSTARLGLREMLRLYPTSERAPDALYFVGQTFAAENSDSAADYYRQVVEKYPTSPRAAAALYNLGLLAERRRDTARAREAYRRVVEQYPRSDEAALARDRLKTLGR